MSLQFAALSCDLCNLRGMGRSHLEGTEVMSRLQVATLVGSKIMVHEVLLKQNQT